MAAVTISKEEAQHVLHFFGHPAGVPAGSFTQTLISAAAKADRLNFARLQLAFPALMAAVWLATQVPDGIATLTEIVGREQQ